MESGQSVKRREYPRMIARAVAAEDDHQGVKETQLSGFWHPETPIECLEISHEPISVHISTVYQSVLEPARTATESLPERRFQSQDHPGLTQASSPVYPTSEHTLNEDVHSLQRESSEAISPLTDICNPRHVHVHRWKGSSKEVKSRGRTCLETASPQDCSSQR